MNRKFLLLSVIIALLAGLLAACAPAAGKTSLKLAPASELPAEVRQASESVQRAYRFNVANPEIMKQIPCYCGCGDMGHASNYQCYVKSDEGGQTVYDQHALGCSICVDITLDTMRMLEEGKSVSEIKAAIDATYSQYGPSNMD